MNPPIITESSNEIQPWILVSSTRDRETAIPADESRSDDQSNCATWRMEDGRVALALFSTRETAIAYQNAVAANGPRAATWESAQPSKVAMARVLIVAYKAGIEVAVLDPNLHAAKRYFQIIDVLRNLRDQLKS